MIATIQIIFKNMEKKLFLVQFTIHTSVYMGNNKKEELLRLVKAVNEEEAKQKIEDKFEYFEHGSDSTSVIIDDISECIE